MRYIMRVELNKPVDSDMLLSLMSLPPGTPRPSELDFFLSLLHHFQSGWALKWASFTWEQKEGQGVSEKETKIQHINNRNFQSYVTVFLSLLKMHLCTWKAKS